MEYVYAALLLHESGEEINEDNITSVLESAGADIDESRVKALVAALEDVEIEDAVEQAAAAPAGAGGGAAAEPAADEGGEEAEESEADEGGDEAEGGDDEGGDEEEEEDVSGEGLGDLFG